MRLAATAFLTLGLVGCAGRTYTASYGYEASLDYGPSGYTYSTYAPPEPLVEVITPAPGPGYAWVNGYWYWNGDTYVWLEGRWAPRPSAGLVWLHHGWTFDNGRYHLHPGRWVRRGYRPPYAFVHPGPRVRYGDSYAVVRTPGVIRRGNVWVAPALPSGSRYVEPRRPGYVYEPARPMTRPAPNVYPRPGVRVVPPAARVEVRPMPRPYDPRVGAPPPRPIAPPIAQPGVHVPPGHVRVAPGRARVVAPTPVPRVVAPRPTPRVEAPVPTPRVMAPRPTPRVIAPRPTPRVMAPRPNPPGQARRVEARHGARIAVRP